MHVTSCHCQDSGPVAWKGRRCPLPATLPQTKGSALCRETVLDQAWQSRFMPGGGLMTPFLELEGVLSKGKSSWVRWG